MRIVLAAIAVLALGACSTTPRMGAPVTWNEARAVVQPAEGQHARGDLLLRAIGDDVRVTGAIAGLAPGSEHGFHVHEIGDCSAPDFSSAGPHYNPGMVTHGDPRTSMHHAGDMLNLRANEQGIAKVDALLKSVSLGGANDILGRAILVHADADDYRSQPAGDSGARIACGIILAD